MTPSTSQIVLWIAEDKIALTAATKLESARATAWNKAATAAAANSVEATKNTREKAGAELSELRAAYDVAVVTEANGKTASAAACKADKKSNACENLKAE